MKPYSLDDKFNEIASGINILYAYLHIMKGYTENESMHNEEISLIDILMNKILDEIDALMHCL